MEITDPLENGLGLFSFRAVIETPRLRAYPSLLTMYFHFTVTPLNNWIKVKLEE